MDINYFGECHLIVIILEKFPDEFNIYSGSFREKLRKY